MSTARVALVGLPSLLGEIVAGALDGQADVAVVGKEEDADVVVISDESAEQERIADLLGHHPGVKVIGISADGRHAYAYRLQRVALGELSPETLRGAIRA